MRARVEASKAAEASSRRRTRALKASSAAARELMRAQTVRLSDAFGGLEVCVLPMVVFPLIRHVAEQCCSRQRSQVELKIPAKRIRAWSAAQVLWQELGGPEAVEWQTMRGDWRALHRKLVARRCRLAADLQHIFGVRPRAGEFQPRPLCKTLFTGQRSCLYLIGSWVKGGVSGVRGRVTTD